MQTKFRITDQFDWFLEKVVCVRLIHFLDKHNIFLESQHNFYKGRSISTALVHFLEDVYKTLDNQEVCVGLFLVLTKALDAVNHDIYV
jgi:hypothetical protein